MNFRWTDLYKAGMIFTYKTPIVQGSPRPARDCNQLLLQNPQEKKKTISSNVICFVLVCFFFFLMILITCQKMIQDKPSYLIHQSQSLNQPLSALIWRNPSRNPPIIIITSQWWREEFNCRNGLRGNLPKSQKCPIHIIIQDL